MKRRVSCVRFSPPLFCDQLFLFRKLILTKSCGLLNAETLSKQNCPVTLNVKSSTILTRLAIADRTLCNLFGVFHRATLLFLMIKRKTLEGRYYRAKSFFLTQISTFSGYLHQQQDTWLQIIEIQKGSLHPQKETCYHW